MLALLRSFDCSSEPEPRVRYYCQLRIAPSAISRLLNPNQLNIETHVARLPSKLIGMVDVPIDRTDRSQKGSAERDAALDLGIGNRPSRDRPVVVFELAARAGHMIVLKSGQDCCERWLTFIYGKRVS